MNNYVTGNTIKFLREKKKLTQAELAKKIGVSDKAVSKWETGRGLPDITLIEPLATELQVSVSELLAGECVMNKNASGNILKSQFYVCPVCGNVVVASGESFISCCGVTLPALEAEEPDKDHFMQAETVENEYYVTIDHDMTKNHYISFIAYVTSNKIEITKQYAEGNAEARFLKRGHGLLYCYCNRHGLMKQKI